MNALRLLVVVVVSAATLARAQSVPELESLRAGFEAKRREADGELLTLAENYHSFLNKQLPALQAQGNLEAILSLQEELKNPGEAKLRSHPELQRAQERFHSNQERLMAARSAKLLALADLYRKNLQETMAALTKLGRLDDALKVKEELSRLGGPLDVPKPNLALAAARNRECLSWLEEALVQVKEVAEEKVRNRLWRDLSIAHAKAGDFKQAVAIARKIADPSVEGEAIAEIAGQQARLRDFDQATALAKTAPNKWDQERALAQIVAIQRQAGQLAQAEKLAVKVQSPAGAALCAIDLAETLRQKGDVTGFQAQIDQAKVLAQSIAEEGAMKEVFSKLVTAEVKAGQVDSAKATAKLYRGHRFGDPLLAVISTQARLGDYSGANATFNAAGFSMFPACLAVASIAVAQADAGKFEEANRSANRLWYSDHKLIALASVAAKKGDLQAARTAAEGLLTADHMDGNRSERYGRALAPTAVLQAKLEGDAAARQWARSQSDPVVRCLVLIALGESRIQPAPALPRL